MHFLQAMQSNQHQTLIDYESLGDVAHLSVPTPEHYWPALYPLALQQPGETVSVITDGIEMSSISMLSFMIQ